MDKRVVTLDIDSRSIRLLEVEAGRVVRWSSTALEPGVVKDGVVAQPEVLGRAVRELMRASGIAEARLVASVAGVYSLTRLLSVPAPATEEARLEHARQALPLPPQQLYISWYPLAATEQMEQYLLLAVPRGVVDSRVLALESAGLSAQALSPKTVALALLAGRPDALIMNVEAASLDVVVMGGGNPRVLYSIALVEDGQTPQQRAETAARELGVAVNFYHSRYPSAPSLDNAPVFLAGPLMADAPFVSALHSAVNRPVAPWDPPLDYPAHLPVAEYAVNLGLALSRLSASGPSEGSALAPAAGINLMPRRYRFWQLSVRTWALGLAFFAAALGLMGLYQLIAPILKDTQSLRQQIGPLAFRLDQIKAENTARANLEKQLAEARRLTSERAVVSVYLDVLQAARPPGVEATSVSFASTGVAIQMAGTCDEAVRYVKALEKTGRFTSVSLPSVGGCRPGGEKLSFSIAASLPLSVTQRK